MRHKETPISSIINDLSFEEERWFAVYTKYKCEKFVVDLLAKKGIGSYIPLISKTKRYASRLKSYDVPLINCHVFVKINKKDYVRVLQTEHVYSFIKQRKNLIQIPDTEINLLKVIVGEIENIELGNVAFNLGDEVEIISGNLTGIRGRLIEEKGKEKFLIQLSNIGVQLMMSVDKSSLRLIQRRA